MNKQKFIKSFYNVFKLFFFFLLLASFQAGGNNGEYMITHICLCKKMYTCSD